MHDPLINVAMQLLILKCQIDVMSEKMDILVSDSDICANSSAIFIGMGGGHDVFLKIKGSLMRIF